eukprot:682114-Pleurochrysis_carterae.AAC.2
MRMRVAQWCPALACSMTLSDNIVLTTLADALKSGCLIPSMLVASKGDADATFAQERWLFLSNTSVHQRHHSHTPGATAAAR